MLYSKTQIGEHDTRLFHFKCINPETVLGPAAYITAVSRCLWMYLDLFN